MEVHSLALVEGSAALDVLKLQVQILEALLEGSEDLEAGVNDLRADAIAADDDDAVGVRFFGHGPSVAKAGRMGVERGQCNRASWHSRKLSLPECSIARLYRYRQCSLPYGQCAATSPCQM